MIADANLAALGAQFVEIVLALRSGLTTGERIELAELLRDLAARVEGAP